MTSFLTADLPSEDEEDQDFLPDSEELKSKVSKRVDKDISRASVHAQSAAKRAKVDAVWDLLNRKVPDKPKQKPLQQTHDKQQPHTATVNKSQAPAASYTPPQAGTPEANQVHGLHQAGEQGQTSRALTAARAAKAGVQGQKDAVTVTRQFAGKKVEICTDSGSIPSDAASAKAAKQKSSLDAVLSSLQATKKANVLDKSRGDWSAFKKLDRTANEELVAHANSNKKYLDKVDFLKRAELNEYEQETAARMKGDIRLRGNL